MKIIKSIIRFLISIILFFISVKLQNDKVCLTIAQMINAIACILLGTSIEDLVNFLKEWPLFFTIKVLLCWDKDIRISFAYLFRIQVEGTYFLIRGNKVNKFQPVGGVYQKYDGSKSILKDIFQEDDEMKKGNEKDLRGKVKGKNLIKFIHWFHEGKEREISCYREFNEELIKTGILNKNNFENLSYSYLGTHKTKIFNSNYYGNEFLLADIYELEMNETQKDEFKKLKEKYDNEVDNSKLDYAFVNSDEINACHTNKRKKKSFDNDISNHTFKILNGEFK